MLNMLRQLLRRGRGEEGAAAVEFALILPILVFLVLGGMDLGHRFYMQNIITNASREGARYAAKYIVDASGNPVQITSTQVSDYVKLPSGLNYNAFNFDTLTVTTIYTGSFPSKIATVTVTALKHWWVLGAFTFFNFPGFTNPQTLTATSAMNVEH